MPRRIDLTRAVSELRAFYQQRRRLPSYAELQRMLRYRSKGGISTLMPHLLRHGVLAKDAQGKLIPTPLLAGGLRLVGTVQAGFPSPAEEELLDTLSLNDFLIQRPQASCLVKVSGDSMIEAGILPGDLVIVERGRAPKPGDIVIAQVDGEWTMKYYEKRQGKAVLRPGNKRYPVIEASRELVIGAVVVAVVRKYR